MPDLRSLSDALDAAVDFREKRGWGPGQTPRHLSSALSVEAGELQEALLWKSDEEVASMLEHPELREAVEEEVGDVLILALLFCHEAGIDPLEAIGNKLEKNAEKYPVGET